MVILRRGYLWETSLQLGEDAQCSSHWSSSFLYTSASFDVRNRGQTGLSNGKGDAEEERQKTKRSCGIKHRPWKEGVRKWINGWPGHVWAWGALADLWTDPYAVVCQYRWWNDQRHLVMGKGINVSQISVRLFICFIFPARIITHLRMLYPQGCQTREVIFGLTASFSFWTKRWA